MLSNPDLQPIMPATRHNLRVMAFAVAGMLCGALIAGLMLLALKEEAKFTQAPLVLGEQTTVYPNGVSPVVEGSPTLHKMDGSFALPLLTLVLCLLIGAGFMRAFAENGNRKNKLAKRFRF